MLQMRPRVNGVEIQIDFISTNIYKREYTVECGFSYKRNKLSK